MKLKFFFFSFVDLPLTKITAKFNDENFPLHQDISRGWYITITSFDLFENMLFNKILNSNVILLTEFQADGFPENVNQTAMIFMNHSLSKTMIDGLPQQSNLSIHTASNV